MNIIVSDESMWNIRSRNLYTIKSIINKMMGLPDTTNTESRYKANKHKLQKASMLIEEVVNHRLKDKDISVCIRMEPYYLNNDSNKITFDVCIVPKNMSCFEVRMGIGFGSDSMSRDSDAIIYKETEWEWFEYENRGEELKELLTDIETYIDEAISTRKIFRN